MSDADPQDEPILLTGEESPIIPFTCGAGLRAKGAPGDFAVQVAIDWEEFAYPFDPAHFSILFSPDKHTPLVVVGVFGDAINLAPLLEPFHLDPMSFFSAESLTQPLVVRAAELAETNDDDDGEEVDAPDHPFLTMVGLALAYGSTIHFTIIPAESGDRREDGLLLTLTRGDLVLTAALYPEVLAKYFDHV